ncbi:Uncharacterized membrane protein [Peptoclostridium litorale DSM 5388]|uniref:Putative integral membrane protein n=1 Tax=Peptoclostridium litorale DSM 5388 TaxID=1121324 RepID=A0A069RHR9_PEPLI|nr:QueT transporter family protein [Peptoclostridium litorale]KDR96564.1 putative integral membrane protein [Peptoclostridium litorale DSM 5388]SIN69075.1 Uncharacterized membrane protein [Peptoclostridium litorale DSM 5388]
MQKFSTSNLVKTAMVAGIYAAVTFSLAPISYGEIQFRLSEILTLLAFVDPLYIPGLVIGCVIANLGSPLGVVDIALGSFATLLSVNSIYLTRKYIGDGLKSLFIASLWPVFFNGIIVGWMLNYLFSIPLAMSVMYVAIGEFAVVSIFGVIIFKPLLDKDSIVKLLTISKAN